MQFRSLIILVCLITSSQFTYAAETNTHRNIVDIRTTTTHNENPLQQGIMLVQVDGPALLYNCTYLGISKDNSYTASAILAAKFGNKPVRFWYTYDAATLGNGACQIETISVH